MQERPNPNIEQIAQDACVYSRNIIKQGSNHISGEINLNQVNSEINNQEISPNNTLNKEISFNEIFNPEHNSYVKELRASYYEKDPIEKDIYLSGFENAIAKSLKFSTGNCQEFAMQGLDYLLTKEPGIRGELFRAKGGDHVFLVINRAINSNPKDPLTWGEGAYVCDPWANVVCKASDLYSHLKKIKRDPNLHPLESFNYFTSDYINKHRNIDSLKNNFKEASVNLTEILAKYIEGLKTELRRLEKKYGEKDNKVEIVKKKIDSLESFKTNLELDIEKTVISYENATDYKKTRSELLKQVTHLKSDTIKEMKFEKSELTTLYMHKRDNIINNNIFFKPKSTTEKNLEKLRETINKKLQH